MSERGAEGQLRQRQAELDAAREAGRAEVTREPPSVPRAPRLAPPKDHDAGAGYWSFIMLAVFMLFVFYVAGKGELQQWINILVPAPPNAPQSQGAKQAPGGSTGSAPPGPTTAQGQPPGAATTGGGNTPRVAGSPLTPQPFTAAGGASTGNTPGGWIKYYTGIITGLFQ